MPTPYSSDDLGRLFDARILTRGRSLVLLGAVKVQLEGDVVVGEVEQMEVHHAVRLAPSQEGGRVVFDRSCTCRVPNCAHLAAVALAALDRFPALRVAQPKGLGNALMAAAGPERQRLVLDLAPGTPPHACFVSTSLVGERSGKIVPTTPDRVIALPNMTEASRALARALGGGDEIRTSISPAMAPSVLEALAKSGQARWQATGKRLSPGDERSFDADAPPNLPPKSAVILSNLGPWYVDAATGQVGRVRLRRQRVPRPPQPEPRARPTPRARAARSEPLPTAAGEPVFVEQRAVPVMQLQRLNCPDDNGRLQMQDVLTLDFDYAGVLTRADDERQFVRVNGPAGPNFIRRDAEAEAAAFEALRQDGFLQVRAPDGANARGRRVFVFRGREAAEQWQGFVTRRVPALAAQGWRSKIDRGFGPRHVDMLGDFDMRVTDAESGRFSLDFGIEIDGVRRDLLPILSRLLERGGFEAAQVEGDELITSLDDGRIVKLPAERMRRLLSIMGDLIEAAQRTADGLLLLEGTEAPNVLELEDLLTTRWQNAAAIETYVARFRDTPEVEPVTLPASFTASLRPYQQQGVEWLQHLRAHSMSGFLADDMGLGKTAQTIAHIAVEHAAGRLDRPALIVVPTSLVANWTAELTKFAPHLKTVVLHGMDRHERREKLDDVHVVVTTYTVLTRDIEEMKRISWHIVTLDEAQAIKSPEARATRAVCQLHTTHQLCPSGTLIE